MLYITTSYYNTKLKRHTINTKAYSQIHSFHKFVIYLVLLFAYIFYDMGNTQKK